MLEDGIIDYYRDDEGRYKISVASVENLLKENTEPKPDCIQLPGNDAVTCILARLNPTLLHQIQDSPLWEKERFTDIPLTQGQIILLVKGYSPGWDCRYAPYFLGGWFYIARSGCWLKKFKYTLGEDEYYHLTSMYTTEKEKGRNLLMDILIEGNFERRILDDRLREVLDKINRR